MSPGRLCHIRGWIGEEPEKSGDQVVRPSRRDVSFLQESLEVLLRTLLSVKTGGIIVGRFTCSELPPSRCKIALRIL